MGWRGNAQPGSWLPVLSLSLLTRSSSSETRTVKVSSLCWTRTMWVISFCLMWDFLSGYCASVCLSSCQCSLRGRLEEVSEDCGRGQIAGPVSGSEPGPQQPLQPGPGTQHRKNIPRVDEAKDLLSALFFFFRTSRTTWSTRWPSSLFLRSGCGARPGVTTPLKPELKPSTWWVTTILRSLTCYQGSTAALWLSQTGLGFLLWLRSSQL